MMIIFTSRHSYIGVVFNNYWVGEAISLFQGRKTIQRSRFINVPRLQNGVRK